MSKWGCGGCCQLHVCRYIAHTFFLGHVLGSMSRWGCGGRCVIYAYTCILRTHFVLVMFWVVCLGGVVVGDVSYTDACAHMRHVKYFRW